MSDEFKELLAEFSTVQKKSFFSDLLIDRHPKWREMRYKIVLNSLKKAFPEHVLSLHKKFSSHEKHYLAFIKEFRAAYRKSIDVPLLHSIARHLFLKIDFSHFALSLVEHMAEAGHPKKMPHGTLIDRFSEIWHGIHDAPHRLKLPMRSMTSQFLRGQFNVKFDPFLQENTPYHLFNTDKCAFIRMGTPTKEGFFACITRTASVNEEFRAFLESYEETGERHLYINLQDRLKGHPGYDEEPRCKALENLALHHPKSLLIVSLNKNIAFWHQSGQFKDLCSATSFKEEFLKQLLAGGYHFCEEAHITKELLKKLLFIVHEEFFANSHQLTLTERQDFVEIFYTFLIEYLIETLKPASVNITCKDGIDRAGTSRALYYLYDQLKTKGHLSPTTISHLKAILFAPALLVKKRPPTYHRFCRFQSAASRLLAHFDIK
jgi:hypothetical protein